MKVVISEEKYDLLEKYSKYYIRFVCGQMMPIPCDLEITNEEFEEIVHKIKCMDDVIIEYMNKIPWTETEFMRRGYIDYLTNIYNMHEEKIEEILNKLDKNKALKNEMYMAIMNEKFPVNCWAKVEGLKASDYAIKLGMNVDETYMYMINKI